MTRPKDLAKACKKFGFRKWPRHFPEELLSDPVVKHTAEKPMNFAEELMRNSVNRQTTARLSEGM
jgi:hypothetical protein